MTAALDFDDLVGEPDRFFAEHWTARWTLHRAARATLVAELLTLDDVDRLLEDGLRAPALRMVRDGAPLAPAEYLKRLHTGGRTVDDAVDVPRVRSLFAAGATLVLQGLHRYHRPVRALARALRERLGHPVQANAYVSPPGARGLPAHHDTHDVFAIQTVGQKRWSFYAPTVALPVPSLDVPVRHDAPGTPLESCLLEAGSCLYLPRGVPHTAATEARASVHVTMGIRSPTWLDVFRRLAADAKNERAFREALPVRFAADPGAFEAELAERFETWARWLRGQSAAQVASREIARAIPSEPPAPAPIAATAAPLPLFDEMVLAPRTPAPAIETTGEYLELKLGDRGLRMPLRLEAPLRLALGGPFTVGALANHLDEEGRAVLCRRLLAEGVLERRGG